MTDQKSVLFLYFKFVVISNPGKKNNNKKKKKQDNVSNVSAFVVFFLTRNPNSEDSVNSKNLKSRCCCGSTILGFSEK